MNKIEKCSATQRGRIVIHKDDTEKRIYPEELEHYQTIGWLRGASAKHRKANSDVHAGKTSWNKGTRGLMKPNTGTFKKGQTPWNKGKKGAQKSWNKGHTKETDTRIAKASESLRKAWEGADDRRAVNAERARERRGTHLSMEQKEQFLRRSYETRSKNNTFNTSTPEEVVYEQLCARFGSMDVFRQYKDKIRYPFRCDFYIKSLDLFIECNLHWTHGGRPYDVNDTICQEQLSLWKDKAITSRFYAEAIKTWTERDVLKKYYAEKYKLNYFVVYKI